MSGEKRCRRPLKRKWQVIQRNALAEKTIEGRTACLWVTKGSQTEEIVLASTPTNEGVFTVLEHDNVSAEFDVVLAKYIIEVVRCLELAVFPVDGQEVALAGAIVKGASDGQARRIPCAGRDREHRRCAVGLAL